MKKLVALLLLPLLLTGCAEELESAREYARSISEASAASLSSSAVSEPPEQDNDASVYTPAEDMTIEETVEAYFEQQYLSYTSFTDIDLSAILDMRSASNKNMITWMKMLTMRRKLILENDFCYVETEAFPYTIFFEEEAEDDQMRSWERRVEEPDVVVYFRIEGEAGKAYPPIMAMNAQHVMMLRQVDGVWKIVMHYFPGSRRKYGTGTITEPDEDEMRVSLAIEFDPGMATLETLETVGAREYQADLAVEYAMRYTEVKNPEFHDIGDWTGNCANFVSQSVWSGFGSDKMTADWNDGEAAWNHVGYFWEYIKNGGELGALQIFGILHTENGDIIQTRPLSMVDEPDRFTHELILVDEETLMLAQNTPAAFVYYSDLVNVETRIIRPFYLK